MKKYLALIIFISICFYGYSQFRISNHGYVTLTAQTQDWHSAFRTYVPTNNSCAYNLWNTLKNRDIFYVNANGWLWSLEGGFFGSDISFKQDISPIDNALEKVLNLKGVKYRFKDNDPNDNAFRFGFIAQDVINVCPEVVKIMPDSTLAITYTDLIAVLTEAIKEQQAIIEQINLDQKKLSEENEIIKKQIILMKNTSSEKQTMQLPNNPFITNENDLVELKVFQNRPNPFNHNTIIDCYIPSYYSDVNLCIFDLTGILKKQISITQQGLVPVELSAESLSPGIYLYLLHTESEISNIERMIIKK